jgi:hypothetical protein
VGRRGERGLITRACESIVNTRDIDPEGRTITSATEPITIGAAARMSRVPRGRVKALTWPLMCRLNCIGKVDQSESRVSRRGRLHRIKEREECESMRRLHRGASRARVAARARAADLIPDSVIRARDKVSLLPSTRNNLSSLSPSVYTAVTCNNDFLRGRREARRWEGRGGEETLRAPRYCAVMTIYERLPRRQKEQVLVNSGITRPTMRVIVARHYARH